MSSHGDEASRQQGDRGEEQKMLEEPHLQQECASFLLPSTSHAPVDVGVPTLPSPPSFDQAMKDEATMIAAQTTGEHQPPSVVDSTAVDVTSSSATIAPHPAAVRQLVEASAHPLLYQVQPGQWQHAQIPQMHFFPTLLQHQQHQQQQQQQQPSQMQQTPLVQPAISLPVPVMQAQQQAAMFAAFQQQIAQQQYQFLQHQQHHQLPTQQQQQQRINPFYPFVPQPLHGSPFMASPLAATLPMAAQSTEWYRAPPPPSSKPRAAKPRRPSKPKSKPASQQETPSTYQSPVLTFAKMVDRPVVSVATTTVHRESDPKVASSHSAVQHVQRIADQERKTNDDATSEEKKIEQIEAKQLEQKEVEARQEPTVEKVAHAKDVKMDAHPSEVTDTNASATAATEAELPSLTPVETDIQDPAQLRALLRQQENVNRQLFEKYTHAKEAIGSLRDLVKEETMKETTPQVLNTMQQLLDETLARDTQLLEHQSPSAFSTPSKRKRQPSRGERTPRKISATVAAAASAAELEKKSIRYQTEKPRTDAVEHSYGTRRTNRHAAFVLESPQSSDEEFGDSGEQKPPASEMIGEQEVVESKQEPITAATSSATSSKSSFAQPDDDSEDYEVGAEEEEESPSEEEEEDEGEEEEEVGSGDLNQVDDEEDEDFESTKPKRSRQRSRVKVEGGGEVAPSSTSSTASSSSKRRRAALPGHHAMTNQVSHISSYPLQTVFVKVQRQWTEEKDIAKKLSQEEKTKLVLVGVRFMVSNENARAGGAKLSTNDIYVVAKDICVLIHKRKTSVAKSIYNFTDAEKMRTHVYSLPREAGRGSGVVGGGASIAGGGASTTGFSTQVLSVLSYRGLMRLLKHSRSTLSSHVLKWVQAQYQAIISSEALLKDHRARSLRGERIKHLPIAQQKQEEATRLKVQEEEEMDVHEGFEHLAGSASTSNTTEDEDESVKEEHVTPGFANEGAMNDILEAANVGSSVITVASIIPSDAMTSAPRVDVAALAKPVPLPPPTPRKRTKPRRKSRSTRSAQPAAKRKKTTTESKTAVGGEEEHGDQNVEMEEEEQEIATSAESQLPLVPVAPSATSYPSLLPSVMRRSSLPSTSPFRYANFPPPSGVTAPFAASRQLFSSDAYPTQHQPTSIDSGMLMRHVLQPNAFAHTFSSVSPYISVPVPTQLSASGSSLSAQHQLPQQQFYQQHQQHPQQQQPIFNSTLAQVMQSQRGTLHPSVPQSISLSSTTNVPVAPSDAFSAATTSTSNASTSINPTMEKREDEETK